MVINSPNYHDYVIKGGKLIGEFEQMYQKAAGTPWHQDEQENWLDVRLTVELLREKGDFDRVIDYGCGLGYYLDILVRRIGAGEGVGFDVSETAVRIAGDLFPGFCFMQMDLMVPDDRMMQVPNIEGNTLHVIRGTLLYVFPKLAIVAEPSVWSGQLRLIWRPSSPWVPR